MTDALTIRPARPSDAPALAILAALDSSTVPSGDLLVAEAAGHLLAAVAVADGSVIADPFVPTADTVAVLRVRAGQVRAPWDSPRLRARHLRLRTASG